MSGHTDMTLSRCCIFSFLQVLKDSNLCVKIKSVRTHAVGKAQPVPVLVYDYYKPGICWVFFYVVMLRLVVVGTDRTRELWCPILMFQLLS